MIWVSDVIGYDKNFNPFVLMNGYFIMHGQRVDKFKQDYPGHYSLVTGINPKYYLIENYLVFDDPEEEILFRLKYL
jgi:hypothetical protein